MERTPSAFRGGFDAVLMAVKLEKANAGGSDRTRTWSNQSGSRIGILMDLKNYCTYETGMGND